MGANLGRLIYFMDAAIDFEKDVKNNVFNPYKFYFKNQDKISKDQAQEIKSSLMTLAGQATQAFEKLPLEQDLHLLQNILYEGL